MIELAQAERNRARAVRIDKLAVEYWRILGEELDSAQNDPYVLSSIMADMRHWCDANGKDFQHMVELSGEHYLNETEGGE